MYLGINFNEVFLKEPEDIIKGLKKYIKKGRFGYVGLLLSTYDSKLEQYTILDIINELDGVACFLRAMVTDLKGIDFRVEQNIICFEAEDFETGVKSTKGQTLLKYAGIFIEKPVLVLLTNDDFLRQEKELKKMIDSVTGGFYTLSNRLSETKDAAELVDRLYRFLKGEFHPATISNEDAPALPDDQAWHIIYVLQEYFGLLDDTFERCCECGRIFNSNEEGGCIDENSETEDGGSYPEEDFGNYCGDCL